MGQTIAQGPLIIANPRWRKANPQTPTDSVADISDVDAEKKKKNNDWERISYYNTSQEEVDNNLRDSLWANTFRRLFDSMSPYIVE